MSQRGLTAVPAGFSAPLPLWYDALPDARPRSTKLASCTSRSCTLPSTRLYPTSILPLLQAASRREAGQIQSRSVGFRRCLFFFFDLESRRRFPAAHSCCRSPVAADRLRHRPSPVCKPSSTASTSNDTLGAMPSRSEITYFGAGPALIPTDILEDAAKALLDYHDTGLGGMELPEALVPLEMTFHRLS